MHDTFDLERFVTAQNPVIDEVRSELRAGRKQGHWMWFIFPQLKGLGHSQMAQYYGIESRAEAEAYLQHAVLGSRLRECAELLNQVQGRSIDAILGYPDNLKFHSSMTLFASIAPEDLTFRDALQKYFAGKPDEGTLALLN